MSVKDDLIAAKALIDTPEKWAKGEGYGSRGCYCAMGAVRAVVSERWDFPDRVPAISALSKALPAPGFDAYAVADFNDADATTHADIMALFDRAIAAAGDA